MEVFQVIMTTEVKDLCDTERHYSHDTDLGIFMSLELADRFIEKHTNDQLEAAMADGDGAWIGAYAKEVDELGYYEILFFRKAIMIEDRKEGQMIRLDYYVKKRIVKES